MSDTQTYSVPAIHCAHCAMSIREEVSEVEGVEKVDVGVIVSDTFGRAWRHGLTDVAIGVAGIAAVLDLRGSADARGRELQVTEVALAEVWRDVLGVDRVGIEDNFFALGGDSIVTLQVVARAARDLLRRLDLEPQVERGGDLIGVLKRGNDLCTPPVNVGNLGIAMQHFAQAVAAAGLADLQSVEGVSAATAKKIYDHFHAEG